MDARSLPHLKGKQALGIEIHSGLLNNLMQLPDLKVFVHFAPFLTFLVGLPVATSGDTKLFWTVICPATVHSHL